MKIIKHNIWVKIAAFVLILALSFVTAFSALTVVTNIANGAYDKSEKLVVKEISWKCLSDAAGMLHNNSYVYYGDKYSKKELKSKFSGKSIFYNEDALTHFGYAVYLKNDGKVVKDKPIRIVNKALSKKINNNDVTLYEESHDTYQLVMYMKQGASIKHSYESGQIPEEIIGHYNEMLKMYQYRVLALIVLITGLLLILALAICMVIAVNKNHKNAKYIPIDLVVVLTGVIDANILYLASQPIGEYTFWNSLSTFIIISGAVLLCTAITGGAILLITARIKQANWYKSTVIYQGIRILGNILKRIAGFIINSIIKPIPLVWKSIVGALILIFANFIICAISELAPFFIESALILAAAILIGAQLKRIQQGGRRLAGGDFEHTIDTEHMILDINEHAENLNSIGRGMEIAVEQQLKSERMRNDLISNVSHDIKTPLTSIINYVDLLKKEVDENDGGNEDKVNEYLEVLDRQSQRLKKLTEDLIEASKAASGHVKIDKNQCNVGMIMSQVTGEFEQRSEEAQLDIIINTPPQDVYMILDGDLMHRTLSNLMSNICKYSQPGTRVYQTLEETGDKIIITYRNTSKYELNISAEELMERFVRGDSSRHTEGSGLGLNIARNLVELQGGHLNISIDGDLFKVIIEFDK